MESKNSRIRYSKEFKRRALVEISAGLNPYDVFKSLGVDVEKLCKNDKKYLSKLLYKWNKEIYKDNEKMYFLNCELTDSELLSEIEYLKQDDDKDYIISDFRKRTSKFAPKYFDIQDKIKEKNTLNKARKIKMV